LITVFLSSEERSDEESQAEPLPTNFGQQIAR